MRIKAALSVLAALAGVALLWAGLAGLSVDGEPFRLRRDAASWAALAACVAGLWLCWLAAAKWTRLPPRASQAANLVCGVLLAGALVAAAVFWFYKLI